jgi:hypothetical protein
MLSGGERRGQIRTAQLSVVCIQTVEEAEEVDLAIEPSRHLDAGWLDAHRGQELGWQAIAKACSDLAEVEHPVGICRDDGDWRGLDWGLLQDMPPAFWCRVFVGRLGRQLGKECGGTTSEEHG